MAFRKVRTTFGDAEKTAREDSTTGGPQIKEKVIKKKWRVLDYTPLTTATGEWEKNLKKGIFVKRNKKTVGIREETVERKERSDIELFPPKSRGHEDG